ncbi:Uncharacterized protein TCM_042337 isoform 2, partial [Theobroma cacao]
ADKEENRFICRIVFPTTFSDETSTNSQSNIDFHFMDNKTP